MNESTDFYGCIDPSFDFVAGIDQCLYSCGIDLRPDKSYVQRRHARNGGE